MEHGPSFISPMAISVNNPNFDIHQVAINYGPAVLVGNWYEDRLTAATDPRAITPGIYGKSGCPLSETVTQHDYKTHHSPSELHILSEKFNNYKQEGHGIKVRSNASSIKMYDGEKFERNYTTTNDIFFRIEPMDVIRYPKMCQHLIGKSPDTLSSFGNQTTTGKIAYVKRQLLLDNKTPVDQSEYKLSFVRKNIVSNSGLRQRRKKQQSQSSIFES